MKTLKQIREEYNSAYNNQETPDQVMLESKSSIPSQTEMPSMLLFRRVSYRMYPGKQVVALYYSKLVDKYLSIPFGPKGNLNVSEAVILDTAPEMIEENVRLPTCNEHFAIKLNEVRMRQINELDALDAATFLPGFAGNVASAASAVRNVRKGNYMSAALDAAGALDPTKVATGVGLSGLAKGAKLGLGAAKAAQTAVKSAGGLGKMATRAGAKIGGQTGARVASKVVKAAPKVAKVAKAAVDAVSGDDQNKAASASASQPEKTGVELQHDKSAKTYSSWENRPTSDPVYKARMKSQSLAPIKENKIVDIRKMVKEGQESFDININGKDVTLNTSMAKRILEVYDSVNTKNKKIVESMLNENLESFKKLLNFSIRN